MPSTLLSFLGWLRDALPYSQSDPYSPTDFIAPNLTRVRFICKTSLSDGGDEGAELVVSIIKQYNRLGFGKPGISELARFQCLEQHLLRMLRLPFDFSRFAGKTLVIPRYPASTPHQAVQRAIDFVRPHFGLTDT